MEKKTDRTLVDLNVWLSATECSVNDVVKKFGATMYDNDITTQWSHMQESDETWFVLDMGGNYESIEAIEIVTTDSIVA